MNDRLRAGAVVAATLALCLPFCLEGTAPKALDPLARGFAAATAGLLGATGAAVGRSGAVLSHPRGFAIEVSPHCTAWLHAVLILVGVLWTRPGWSRGLTIAGLGVAALVGLNLLRLAFVYAAGAHSDLAFELSHRVLGEALLAAAVLVPWRVAATERPA